MKFVTRPLIMGTHGVVSSGHYLASVVGFNVLMEGGNAVDAGVAMGLALAVLEPNNYTIGGEAPILIYSADNRRVYAINGQGTAPKSATIDWFRGRGISLIPGDGFLPATVPAAFDSWVTALANFGTLSLSDVLAPAVELAEEGFPVYQSLHESIKTHSKRFIEEWPTTARVFLPNGRVPKVGEVLTQQDLAETFKRVIEVEKKNLHKGRRKALQAARDYFYKGEVARKIVKFIHETEILDASGMSNKGLLSLEDFASYTTKIEEPVKTVYRGYTVYKCGPWTQGPVFLQQLNILEGFDLRSLGHNSPDYIHIVVETAKLAFADRERYYGDPDFVNVPLDVLLSKEYAKERRELIDLERASLEVMPGYADTVTLTDCEDRNKDICFDTTHLDVIDRYGNMVSATPSGGWIQSSPLIEGLGFPLGTRGQMFHLNPNHPEALAPRKRPSTTLTPSLIMKDEKPLMVFGTPGGDQQDQWSLQFFLNFVDFGMNLQEAVDAPTFHTLHFPSSFYPHEAHPGLVAVEDRITEETRDSLIKRDTGYRLMADGRMGVSRQ
ncbi:MAG: gamma-glutamyltransferase family protein [Candidatus Bathyarchaeia archaeon]